MCESGPVSRRKAMKWVVLGIGAATGGIIGIPGITSMLSPTIKYEPGKEHWRALGSIADFPMGEITSAQVEVRLGPKDFVRMALPKEVYVWRRGESEFVVYSKSCTDLGCPVRFDRGSECFFCPCHGGIFSKNGEVMAGPPKGPLYRYHSRVIDGFLEIDLGSVPVVA